MTPTKLMSFAKNVDLAALAADLKMQLAETNARLDEVVEKLSGFVDRYNANTRVTNEFIAGAETRINQIVETLTDGK
jgi:hypothetical protein